MTPRLRLLAAPSLVVGTVGADAAFAQKSGGLLKVQQKRKRLVWEIDRPLQEDQARPIIYHLRFATCWQPRLKGLKIMVNSVFNGWRFEDIWLD